MRGTILIGFAVAACSSRSSAPDPAKDPPAPATPPATATPPAPPLEDPGSCELSITGAVTRRVRASGGPMALASDYFMTPAELRREVELLEPGATPEAIDARLKQDPVLRAFQVSCLARDVQLGFRPSTPSVYADAPFGAKRYELMTGADDRKGKIVASLDIDDRDYQATGGHFEVTAFDAGGMKARFAFTARDDDQRIVNVEGSLDYRCAWDHERCVAARRK